MNKKNNTSHEFKSSKLLLSPQELEKREKIRLSLLSTREKEFQRCAENILEFSTKISKISGQLKQKRADEKDFRVSQSRITAHTQSIDLDRSKRPSDRGYDIRAYSKMDKDVWRYDQVRDWFNSYATEQEPYNYIPSKEGYTLRID